MGHGNRSESDSRCLDPTVNEQKNWYGICTWLALMIKRIDRQRHVLVVDDESLVRRSVHILLQGDGYLVDVARSGAEALALFEPGKFDMIFTDYLMPDMKGDALAAAIKKRSPEQPVIMLTAFIEKFQAAECPPDGVDSCIGKPFELETLRAAIDRYAPA
jgi:CheY-like chemotaxis protein